MNKPKKIENFTQGCTCDECGKNLSAPSIWVWEEHFCCSRECVVKAYYDARPELVKSSSSSEVQS